MPQDQNHQKHQSQKAWTAVILAAGHGMRMKSATPKTLHRVSGMPMLKHVSDAIRAAGVTDVTVVVAPDHADSPEFRAAVASSAEDPENAHHARFVTQAEQLGTANALQAANDVLAGAEAVLVLYGDTPLIASETLKALINEHENSGATATIVTASPPPVDGLGRIVRGLDGNITGIVEQKDADESTLAIPEVSAGWYAFDASWIKETLPEIERSLERSASGEYYLTDAIEHAVKAGLPIASISIADSLEILGVNTRAQLAIAEEAMRQRQRSHWMEQGVTLIDPAATYIDAAATLAQDVTIHPNTHILGTSTIATGCEIGPNSIVIDTSIDEDSNFTSSHAEGARIGKRVNIGPFSRLRPGAILDNDVYVGNYAEIKNSTIGSGTHIGHFSYVGDAELGRRVNIGAGTVTANYDGRQKNRTVIDDDAQVGSGSMLVAPVHIGSAAVIGAGAVVTHDVPAGDTVTGVPARTVKAIASSNLDEPEQDTSAPTDTGATAGAKTPAETGD